MKKNIASQIIGAQMVNIADGTPFTGTARVAITIDGGVQDITPGGTVTHEGRGFHSYNPTQAETNGDHLGFTFDDSGALAVPVTVQVFTVDAIAVEVWNEGTRALTDKAGFSLSATGLDAIGQAATGMVEIAKAIWDRVLTGGTHNISTSAGRRIREISTLGVYELGLIWYDNVRGTAGSVDFENGTAVLPLTLIADANIILASLPLHGIHFAAGSSVTFAAAMDNLELTGEGYIAALGGQSIAGSSLMGGSLSGISIGVPDTLQDCFLGACTFAGGHFIDCALLSTITLSGATEYFFDTCHHAGASVLDFGVGILNTTVHVHGYRGVLTISNLGNAGVDVLHFDSPGGRLILDASCVGGTVNYSGTFELDSSASSGVTLNNRGAINVAADAILIDTDELQGDWADAGRLDTLLDAIPTTAMRGTDDGALATALVTAQNDLDKLTGADGAILATSQPNYAPAKAGDAMTLTNLYDFAKGTVAMVEAYAANGVAPTPIEAMFAIHQRAMQFGIIGANLTVRKLDDTTTAFIITHDSNTSPTDAKRV